MVRTGGIATAVLSQAHPVGSPFPPAMPVVVPVMVPVMVPVFVPVPQGSGQVVKGIAQTPGGPKSMFL